MGQPRPLFVYFRSFQTQFLQEKTVGFSGTRTRIIGVEGEHTDHLTTTTAPLDIFLYFVHCWSNICNIIVCSRYETSTQQVLHITAKSMKDQGRLQLERSCQGIQKRVRKRPARRLQSCREILAQFWRQNGRKLAPREKRQDWQCRIRIHTETVSRLLLIVIIWTIHLFRLYKCFINVKNPKLWDHSIFWS